MHSVFVPQGPIIQSNFEGAHKQGPHAKVEHLSDKEKGGNSERCALHRDVHNTGCITGVLHQLQRCSHGAGT